MRIVVYLDVVFLINFTMDFILLILTEGLLKKSTTYRQIILASVLGGVWSCLAETRVFPPNLVILITYFIVPALLVKICFIKSKGIEMIRATILFLLLTSTLGGIASALYYHLKIGLYFHETFMKNGMLLMVLALSIIFIFVGIRNIHFSQMYSKKICKVIVRLFNENVKLNAIVDTGNVLMDPYENKPIHIVEKAKIIALIDGILDDDAAYKRNIHFVPINTVSGNNGCIMVLRTDYIQIDDGEKKLCEKDALIGLSDVKLSRDNAFEMLLNGNAVDFKML